MKSEIVKISEVKSNPNNPRIIKDDNFKKLVNSIKEFPKMLNIRPIVVNDDMIVLGGNMRLKACKEAGLKEVPIIRAGDLTEDEQRQFIIKDNVSGGEWDWDMLVNDWDTEKLEEWGLDTWPEPLGEGISEPYSPPDDPFSDEGVGYKEQYGVIVKCTSEREQEQIFKRLSEEGFECKIVVT